MSLRNITAAGPLSIIAPAVDIVTLSPLTGTLNQQQIATVGMLPIIQPPPWRAVAVPGSFSGPEHTRNPVAFVPGAYDSALVATLSYIVVDPAVVRGVNFLLNVGFQAGNIAGAKVGFTLTDAATGLIPIPGGYGENLAPSAVTGESEDLQAYFLFGCAVPFRLSVWVNGNAAAPGPITGTSLNAVLKTLYSNLT